MSKRYRTILDGSTVSDVDENASGEESGATYNYYGYARTDGSWIIMREKTDGTEFRFTVGSDSYASNWDDRINKIYRRVIDFPKLP